MGEEERYVSRLVQNGNDTHAGVRQRAGTVQDLLQDGIEVKALVDAKRRFGQHGQADA